MFNLTGKTALVTGSTQGIGKAIAAALARQGACVIVHGAEDLSKCRQAAADIPGASFATADLAEEDSASRLYSQTGDVDILVLNASVQFRRSWNTISSEEFDIQVRVNLKASLELIRIYEPHMSKQSWGRIVTVGSVQQHRPHPQMLVYAATKEAQMSIVKILAMQLGPQGVTVNNLSPGVIATPRNEEALANKDYAAQLLNGIPARRIGTAEDCAGAALLLCSEAGGYITGVDLLVDGGMHL